MAHRTYERLVNRRTNERKISYLYKNLGVVKFHSTSLNDSSANGDSCDSVDPIPSGTGLLERLVTSVRDSLGVELSPCTTIAEDQCSEDTVSDRTGKRAQE